MEVSLINHSYLDIPKNLLYFNFNIKGISRACLQELARHRAFSLSVKSSRYTIAKDLKNEKEFLEDFERASKYIVLTKNKEVDMTSIKALDNLRNLVSKGYSNDVIKYAMPECFKVDLALTCNFEGLYNFLVLRTSNHALAEIRDLAYAMYGQIPLEIKNLFSIYIPGE